MDSEPPGRFQSAKQAAVRAHRYLEVELGVQVKLLPDSSADHRPDDALH
jgi:hypothetical protein